MNNIKGNATNKGVDKLYGKYFTATSICSDILGDIIIPQHSDIIDTGKINIMLFLTGVIC